MKKTNKTILKLLSLASLMFVSGCAAGADTTGYAVKADSASVARLLVIKQSVDFGP